MNDGRQAPEMQDLTEQVGEFVYAWGFKRIHGKIWTHLFLAATALDAADLVKQLNISKALVSISLRELVDFEVIHMTGKSTKGTQLYKVNSDIPSVIVSVLRQREKRMLSRLEAAHNNVLKIAGNGGDGLGQNQDESQHSALQISPLQLQQLGALIQNAATSLDSFINRITPSCKLEAPARERICAL